MKARATNFTRSLEEAKNIMCFIECNVKLAVDLPAPLY